MSPRKELGRDPRPRGCTWGGARTREFANPGVLCSMGRAGSGRPRGWSTGWLVPRRMRGSRAVSGSDAASGGVDACRREDDDDETAAFCAVARVVSLVCCRSSSHHHAAGLRLWLLSRRPLSCAPHAPSPRVTREMRPRWRPPPSFTLSFDFSSSELGRRRSDCGDTASRATAPLAARRPAL